MQGDWGNYMSIDEQELLYGYLKVLWGDTMSGIFKALVAS